MALRRNARLGYAPWRTRFSFGSRNFEVFASRTCSGCKLQATRGESCPVQLLPNEAWPRWASPSTTSAGKCGHRLAHPGVGNIYQEICTRMRCTMVSRYLRCSRWPCASCCKGNGHLHTGRQTSRQPSCSSLVPWMQELFGPAFCFHGEELQCSRQLSWENGWSFHA